MSNWLHFAKFFRYPYFVSTNCTFFSHLISNSNRFQTIIYFILQAICQFQKLLGISILLFILNKCIRLFFFFPFLILFFFYRDFLEMLSNLNIFNWHILMSPTLHEFKYMHSRLFFDDSPVCKNVIIDVMKTNDFHTYL